MSVTSAQPIAGPMVWRGADLTHSTDWIHAVTAAEVHEMDAALRAAQRRGLDWRKMTRDDFPIPRLARSLAEVSRELEDGRGLVLLRRIPVERYSEDELRIIYWGLGLHLGTPRYQNPNGELIGDVRDENRVEITKGTSFAKQTLTVSLGGVGSGLYGMLVLAVIIGATASTRSR